MEQVSGNQVSATKRNNERSIQERDWKKLHDRFGERVLSLLKEDLA